MRVVFFVIGLGAAVGGLWLLVTALNSETVSAMDLCTSSALNVAALAYFLAAAKNYRGHWSFVIGVALLVFAISGLCSEIDDARAGVSEDLGLAVFLIVILSVVGILSLWSGHKLNTCLLQLDREGEQ